MRIVKDEVMTATTGFCKNMITCYVYVITCLFKNLIAV